MNLNGKYHVGVPAVTYGNSQFCDDDNFAAGKQAKFESSHGVILNNLKPPYFQQEPSLFHKSYKEESAKFPVLEHIGIVSQSDKSIFKSDYNRELLSAFFYAKNKEQGGSGIPQFPVAIETSSCKEACGKLKNGAYVSNEYETTHLGKQHELNSGCKIHALVESGLSANASISDERITKIGEGFSVNMHEQSRPIRGGLNPVISEKIWDGLLKLNTSTTVSTVAFFKSGEKVQDLNWPDHIEIKGKVRLHAFEKFIQELPRSRNRALMVISLCWKVGSCSADLEGMREVAKGYRESEKVGFAQILPCIDLYLCPRSDTIITILAKYGFFKGMAAVEENHSSLIGCVVWRRNQSSSNPTSKQEQPVKSAGLSTKGINPSPIASCEYKKQQEVKASVTDLESALDLPASESSSSISPNDVTENKPTPSTNNLDNGNDSYCSSVQTVTTSVSYSSPLVPAQQNSSQWPSLNLLQENMKQQGIPLALCLGSDKHILVSGPRPLIPVNSSNFQFQPQLLQKALSNLGDADTGEQKETMQSFQATHSFLPGVPPLPVELLQMLVQSNSSNVHGLMDGSSGNDSTCVPSFHAKQPVLPAPLSSPAELLQMLMQSNRNVPNLEGSKSVLPSPPPLPAELLQKLIESNKSVPKPLSERILETEVHAMHQLVTRGPADNLEKQEEAYGGSNDDEDLPEFDFDSACGASGLNPSGDMKERRKPLPVPSERVSLADHLEEFSPEKPSIQVSKFSSHSSCIDRVMEFGHHLGHNIGSSSKGCWEDDDNDDDMPEWCPPDAEIPEQTFLSSSSRLLSHRSLQTPMTTAPPPFHYSQSRDLQQRSQRGLAAEVVRSGVKRHAEPPLGRSHDAKYNRRPATYESDRRRRRR